jgi:hypothetical protein
MQVINAFAYGLLFNAMPLTDESIRDDQINRPQRVTTDANQRPFGLT